VQQQLKKRVCLRFAGKDIVLEVGSRLKCNQEVVDAYKTLRKDELTSDDLCDVLLDQVITCWVSCKAKYVTK
jgi:hypothetical protein